MDYDLAVIGSGWAGFNAALKAKASGLKVALIDKGPMGGTCLNRGCIPTKALLQSAKILAQIKKSKQFGVNAGTPAVNFSEVQARKEKIIQQLRQGMEFMAGGIDLIQGQAAFLSPDTLKAGPKELKAKYILIATGSRPTELSTMKFDHKKIISSDDILDLKEIPRSLLIIGGGVIGCEFATLFSALGTQVTIAEKMPQLLPAEDSQIAKKLETIFKKKGIKANTNIDAASLNLADFDYVLVCVGREPVCDSLGLGKITVDDYLKTNTPNVYAAGDCTGSLMLAHYAAYQGIVAAENIIAGKSLKKADNVCVPNCIFTDPEIASVGLSEEAAKNKGIELEVKKFDFLASGMARILDEAEGFIKVIIDKQSNKIIGACLIGPRATELISIFGLAISCGLTATQVKETIFAHPTMSESIHEAIK